MTKKSEKPAPEIRSKESKVNDQKAGDIMDAGIHHDDQDNKAGKQAKKLENAILELEKEYEQKLEEFGAAAKEWQDKYIRLSAEFDNYRKRTLREKAELITGANENLLKEILVVVDDFERGIEQIDKSEDLDALKQGIHLIYNKFKEFLQQKGMKEIDAKGQPFDVDLHEAITKIQVSTEDEKGKVMDVVAKGYMLHDRVIRYAKVVVGD